jgi:hypothetical protein
MDLTNVKTLELQQEVLELRRGVKKLKALLRLALALLRSSGVSRRIARRPAFRTGRLTSLDNFRNWLIREAA